MVKRKEFLATWRPPGGSASSGQVCGVADLL